MLRRCVAALVFVREPLGGYGVSSTRVRPSLTTPIFRNPVLRVRVGVVMCTLQEPMPSPVKKVLKAKAVVEEQVGDRPMRFTPSIAIPSDLDCVQAVTACLALLSALGSGLGVVHMVWSGRRPSSSPCKEGRESKGRVK